MAGGETSPRRPLSGEPLTAQGGGVFLEISQERPGQSNTAGAELLHDTEPKRAAPG